MVMKKLINDPANITAELLEGFTLAYADKVKLESGKLVVRARPKAADKVALVTLGGAGHEPALSGFVGEGMLDISVVGDIFAAPAAPKVFEALKKANRPAGVLLVVLNHAGDVMSAKIAMEMAKKQGLNVRTLLTHEDIAPGANAPAAERRGLVGCIPLYKIAGAAAEEGKTLDEVFAIAERFNSQMATLAVAMKTATHPSTGQSIFELADDQMEIGMGQHGEPGTGPARADDRRRDGRDDARAAVGGRRRPARRPPAGDPQRLRRHDAHGVVHRLPGRASHACGARHRAGLAADRRVPDRAGDGRLPDVRGQDGRRIDPPVEGPLRHAVFDGA